MVRRMNGLHNSVLWSTSFMPCHGVMQRSLTSRCALRYRIFEYRYIKYMGDYLKFRLNVNEALRCSEPRAERNLVEAR